MEPHTALPEWNFSFCPAAGRTFDWQEIVEAYDWVKVLSEVPQNPIHHGEGDVGTHTRMVLEELVQHKEWQEESPVFRSVLFLSALMHDIGKAVCTKVEHGSITSPRHALRGARMARSIMYRGLPDGVPFPVREYIFQLVCHHGVPLWDGRKTDPEKRWRGISQHLSLKHLALLAEADVRGRICTDKEELLFRVELFREKVINDQCYDQVYPFANGLARYVYFSKEGGSPLYVPFDDTKFEVILLAGLPGSGKNTWVREHAAGLPQINLDDIRQELNIGPKDNQGRVLQLAKERAKELLRNKQPFVWNATNLIRLRRQALISLFTTYKARVRIVYLEVPYQELLRRNRKREHALPPNVLDRFVDRLEAPELMEAHRVEYWVDGNDNVQ